jgi:hypothetical protein
MSFKETVAHHFPGTRSELMYVAQTYDQLEALGFSAENSITCVGRCRDELTRPLKLLLHHAWGAAFELASLAGMMNAGRTGFAAAIGHAPTVFDRRRYIFYAFSHIGIAADGSFGLSLRPGQPEHTTTCGALAALLMEIHDGRVDDALDEADWEQSLLRRRLLPLINSAEPDLIDLTRIAHDAMLEDLEHLVALTVDPGSADYAIFTGIQIHGPQSKNYVWPATSYALVDGKRHSLMPGS